MTNGRKIRILLCGGAFRGNMGAPAMYDSIVDELKRRVPNVDVFVLSKYPTDDRDECFKRGYYMISYPTVKQLVKGGGFYLLGSFLKALHISHKGLVHDEALRAYYDNDILVDASGIAFTDDRSFGDILINTLWFLPGIVSGIPMVKLSQSMGPYRKWYVRIAAKTILNRLEFMVCRGNTSYKLTRKFLPGKRIYNLPDTAFCLKPAGRAEIQKLQTRYRLAQVQYISVGPSYVMRDLFGKGRYSDIISFMINKLAADTEYIYTFIFVPHSWKHKAQIGVDSVNDDLTVCREISTKLDKCVKHTIIDRELSARQLKGLISDSYIAIGSRYHFLIAALSSGVPCMALGWSHKYREVFSEFDIQEYVLEHNEMNEENVSNLASKLLNHRDDVKEKIVNHLPDVIERSEKNEVLIAEFLQKNGLLLNK